MSEALLGAIVGAAAGIAGGCFAALGSLRASQLAARAPLGHSLHRIVDIVITMRAIESTTGNEYLLVRREFESRWSEFSIQQRILCPSERLAELMALVRAAALSQEENPADLAELAGQTVEKVTRMVGAHSNTLFRFRARRQEAKIIREWLESEHGKKLRAANRTRLAALVPKRRCFG